MVPVTVRAPAPGTVRLTVSPAAVTMVNGSTAWLDAAVATTRPGISTGARFVSADTTVVAVDYASGTLRATGPGTTEVFVVSHADPSAEALVPVTVTRGSAVAQGLAFEPFT